MNRADNGARPARPPQPVRRGGALILGPAAATVAAWLALSAPRPPAEEATGAATTNRAAWHPVHIRPAPAAPRFDTGQTNRAGEPVTVACSTCHTTTKPNLETRGSADLDEFHQGLRVNHGHLPCLSCHHAQNYDRLRLASGKPVEFADVMMLCAQCHGTAMRDYERGSHGGMSGYWDLTRGPRTRNHCVHCHDPHWPKYPPAMPVFAPRDRRAARPGGGH
jgi:hypothetical protein